MFGVVILLAVVLAASYLELVDKVSTGLLLVL